MLKKTRQVTAHYLTGADVGKMVMIGDTKSRRLNRLLVNWGPATNEIIVQLGNDEALPILASTICIVEEDDDPLVDGYPIKGIAKMYERMVGYLPMMFGSMISILMRDELRPKIKELIALYDADVEHKGVVGSRYSIRGDIYTEEGGVSLGSLVGPLRGTLWPEDTAYTGRLRELYETRPAPLVDGDLGPESKTCVADWIKEFDDEHYANTRIKEFDPESYAKSHSMDQNHIIFREDQLTPTTDEEGNNNA